MKLTNKHKLPEPFVDLVSFDSYNKGRSDFTTTELISPPKASILRRRHDDEIEEDVSLRMWAMSGSAKHFLLERIAKRNPERYIAEKRLYATVLGKTIGGQIDLFDRKDNTLYDYKETKVYKIRKGDMREWTAQGNINRWLCVQNGVEPEMLRNIAFLKDWSDSETGRDGYPEAPVVIVPLEVWPLEKTKAFIEERVRLHLNFSKVPDDSIPPCTKEERWEGEDLWKVKKEGGKKSVAVFPNEEYPDPSAAERVATERAFELTNKGKGAYHVLHVPAEPTRCTRFCGANKFCNYYLTHVLPNLDKKES